MDSLFIWCFVHVCVRVNKTVSIKLWLFACHEVKFLSLFACEQLLVGLVMLSVIYFDKCHLGQVEK